MTQQPITRSRSHHLAERKKQDRFARGIIWAITLLLATNQLMLITVTPKGANAATETTKALSALFGVKTASAEVIIAPQLNADGKTTSLVEQPTISAVPANPKSGDDLADAKVVMLSAGKPAYAPDDISFDDPVNAQNKWGAYEQSIQLTDADDTRYNNLIQNFLCSYCCGSPMAATRNRQCGCAHAKAARGYFKYMIKTFGDTYSDAQLLGEGFRWQAIWYPKGAVEDYLLATGKVNVIGHGAHGGVGADGMHGLTK